MPQSAEGADLLLYPAPAAAQAADLPRPARERFQPLRAGIVNLWQYDDQELHFHDGRLILRGENGSGKSKALELLLPFLFDADLSPQRLDPFGSTSRTMEWNLLQDGRYESRVGYVWLEFGRRDDTAPNAAAAAADRGEEGAPGGVPELFWTLGCGLRASERSRRVDAWYFLTRLRVGGGLSLTSGRTPLLKEQLRQGIGSSGWVFENGREYREKLDQQLFGFGSDRFAALRHLLLQLRRPHLSEKLDPRNLAELLKESLPPLDRDRIGELAEGFERLEKDQQDLARAQAAERGVSTFLQLYQDFARGVGRGRAGEVRQSDSRYHKTASEVREAQTEVERLDQLVAEVGERERHADEEIAMAAAAVETLADSPAMRSAGVLRVRREQADQLAKSAADAEKLVERQARTIAELRVDLAGAGDEEQRLERERAERNTAAAEAARGAGLDAAYEAALRALPGNPGAANAVVEAAVQRRREGIAELRRLGSERDRAQSAEERAEDRLKEAAEQLRAASRRRQSAESEAGVERDALEAALMAWWTGVAELRLEATEVDALRAGIAILTAPEEGSLAAAIAEAARRQRDSLVAERTSLAAEVRRVRAEREATEEERRRVAAAQELGPQAPPWRSADRSGRAGAPLYLLCDFAPWLDEASRASLEAVLQAAGLLDAWVMPDGGVLAAETFDAFAVPDRRPPEPLPCPAAGQSLAGLLVAVPGHGVGQEVLEALLRSVAVEPRRADLGGPDLAEYAVSAVSAVSTVGEGGGGGAFRLGPLRGAAAKPVAEHIGAGARAAARERRLLELAALLAALDREHLLLTSRDEALDARLANLDRDVAAAPTSAPLRRALAQAAAAMADEGRRAAEQTAAVGRAMAARAALDAAQGHLEARARDLDLPAHLDRLDEYADQLRGFVGRFHALSAVAPEAQRARERATRAALQLEQGVGLQGEFRRRAEEGVAAAALAQATHAELEAVAGAEAREVVARHAAHVERRDGLVKRRKSLAAEAEEHKVRRAGIQERLTQRRAELEERERERMHAAARLRRFTDGGLLTMVLAAPPEEPPAFWSLTRTLDVARDVERENDGVDLSPVAASRRANRLHERFRLLESELGADYQASLEQDEDLAIVRVLYNGKEHDVAGLQAVLREGIEVRRALLAEHERELLRRFLLEEVGGHLRDRLQRARTLVRDMNEILESCRTASGMALKLAWDPSPEAPDEVREVVRLLQTDLDILPDGERRRIEAFFLRRIEEARQQLETIPWRDHLLGALDYRSWFAFRILRRSAGDDAWEELTRRRHAATSGGEKAVALHLPLFAAAAAHYRSALAAAPRVILLDEAFVGIDQAMRGRCMGLLVALDLDFLMTSHDEWGCYEELPGVAIAHLSRDPTLDGVMAEHFVWNGRSLHETTSKHPGDGG
jgi:uncharacterized protein (TIGR02680 family)